MGVIYETRETKARVGIKCDRCGEEHYDFGGDFTIDYTFGYGTQLDGSNVKAAICDECLPVVLREVTGAQWSH